MKDCESCDWNECNGCDKYELAVSIEKTKIHTSDFMFGMLIGFGVGVGTGALWVILLVYH